MKAKLHFLVLALAIAFVSCSEDDSVPNNTLSGDNGFEYNRTAYVTDMVYITDSNEIILSSRDITNGTAVQVDFASFTTLNGELKEKTYAVNRGLTSCAAIVEGTWINGEVQNGNNILGEDNAEGGFMRIVHYDAFDQQIKIIFEFTRKDGKLVAGTYSGNFDLLTL